MEVKEELTLTKHTIALMHSTPQNLWVFLRKADFMEAEISQNFILFLLIHYILLSWGNKFIFLMKT